MKNIYESHFLMDINTVKDYCKNYLHYFEVDEEIEAIEIGDGNINYVFKIYSKKDGRSLVIKQADKYLRSSGRPLDLYRNKIEAEILQIEAELASDFVPEIYDYNESMFALAMEDISEYKNLRNELLNGKTFEHLADNISTFIAKTLLPTTDLVLDRHEKKNKVRLFTNVELCDISEDLVFTEPYFDYKKRNIISVGNEKFVEQTLYNDEDLKAEVGYLRNNFMNNAQALIHGDLHSGSIFINQKGLKVIDPEFAFYGPIGYDIGNVIGNLFFSLFNKLYNDPENKIFINWLKNTISSILDLVMIKLDEKYNELVTFPLYNETFKRAYLKNILSDTLGYAGTEMIRRTVGDSKVAELNLFDEGIKKNEMEQVLVLLGVVLIKERGSIYTGSQLIKRVEEVIHEYENRK